MTTSSNVSSSVGDFLLKTKTMYKGSIEQIKSFFFVLHQKPHKKSNKVWQVIARNSSGDYWVKRQEWPKTIFFHRRRKDWRVSMNSLMTVRAEFLWTVTATWIGCNIYVWPLFGHQQHEEMKSLVNERPSSSALH